jgi:hypothetical protein
MHSFSFSRFMTWVSPRGRMSRRAHSLVNHNLDKSNHQNPINSTDCENAMNASHVLSSTSHKMSSHVFLWFQISIAFALRSRQSKAHNFRPALFLVLIGHISPHPPHSCHILSLSTTFY